MNVRLKGAVTKERMENELGLLLVQKATQYFYYLIIILLPYYLTLF